MELAASRDKPELDNEKLFSIASNVKAALDQSEQSLAMGLHVAKRVDQQQSFKGESIKEIYPMLRYAYACYLKITEIRSRGHLRDRAVKNFVEFFDWCESMCCHISLISQAAFALFGGSEEAQRLLTVKKNKTPLDAAWGAAWDTWYIWMIQNYLPMHALDGIMQRSIFVTEDSAAAFVAGQCTPKAFFINHGSPFATASGISYGFPYYADKTQRLNDAMRERDMNRLMRIASQMGNQSSFDHGQVEQEIHRLEQLLGLLKDETYA